MSTQSPFVSFKTGHVGLNVRDLKESRAFYQEILGLEAMGASEERGKAFTFLGRDGDLVLTLWQQADHGFDSARAGLHHLAFEVADLDEVQAAERRLRARGATIFHQGVVAHREGAGSGGIFFADPDGTRLEIYAASGVENHDAPSGAAPTCGFF